MAENTSRLDVPERGLGVAKDYGQALSLFQKSAGTKNALAEKTIFGWMYQNGVGVEKDYAQAFSWFQKAAAGWKCFGREQSWVDVRERRGRGEGLRRGIVLVPEVGGGGK